MRFRVLSRRPKLLETFTARTKWYRWPIAGKSAALKAPSQIHSRLMMRDLRRCRLGLAFLAGLLAWLDDGRDGLVVGGGGWLGG